MNICGPSASVRNVALLPNEARRSLPKAAAVVPEGMIATDSPELGHDRECVFAIPPKKDKNTMSPGGS